MIVIVVMIVVVVVIAMVFVIPVALMHSPTFAVVVVVGMSPVGAGVRRALPGAGDPDVAVATRSPVAVDPDEVWCRHGRRDFVADYGRGRADIDLDLAECRCCQGRCGDETT